MIIKRLSSISIPVAGIALTAVAAMGAPAAAASPTIEGAPTPTVNAAQKPSSRTPSQDKQAAQDCIFEVQVALYITFDGGETRLLMPGEQVYGANQLQNIWVFSYSDARSGWVYRDYNNLRIVGCD